MSKEKTQDNWIYKYPSMDIGHIKKDNIRFILGEVFNIDIKKSLICIGINPSTATPNNLDQTLMRVSKYAKEYSKIPYGAWYMINIYPQRATNPDDMHTDDDCDKCRQYLHERNIKEIKELLNEIEEADVWCAWGDIIQNPRRRFLSQMLVGDEKKSIDAIIDLCKDSKYELKNMGKTKIKCHPRHPRLKRKKDQLRDFDDIEVYKEKIRSYLTK